MIRKYRKQTLEGYTEDQVFTIDLGTSSIEEWLTVFRYSLLSVFLSFNSIYSRIAEREAAFTANAYYHKRDTSHTGTNDT